MDDVLVGKVTISASLKKIHFLKISEQAPVSLTIFVYLKVLVSLRNEFSLHIMLTFRTNIQGQKMQIGLSFASKKTFRGTIRLWFLLFYDKLAS